ncbi:hypothetical protein NOR_06235 [Metarhizium rileyi]|uniref:Uncharacterized protein n=1 Tax=Metarhizium rileyi (strain RCEF 4871) TaxID=1649241 RepID=A0A167AWI3_METRR|nr:hypothetical protein NOR_06235 [Metarhizium rileyi RCEF 4871]
MPRQQAGPNDQAGRQVTVELAPAQPMTSDARLRGGEHRPLDEWLVRTEAPPASDGISTRECLRTWTVARESKLLRRARVADWAFLSETYKL